jgi:hypothetical protein
MVAIAVWRRSACLPGCFGMTELGHGSNVMGIETKVRCAAVASVQLWFSTASACFGMTGLGHIWHYGAGPQQQRDGH